MLFLLYFTLLSYSFGNSSSCLDKVPLYLNLPKETLYTYKNSVTATIWSNDGDKTVKSKTINFRTLSHPAEKTSSGYELYEVVIDDVDPKIAEFIGATPSKLPWYKFQPFYPTGKLEGDSKGAPEIIKTIDCGKVFSSSEKTQSIDGWLMIEKESVNKIIGFEKRKVDKKKKISLIRMETRKQVTIKGKYNGKGTESITYYFISGTGELYEELRKFKYEYRTGFGTKKITEYASGEYLRRLEKIEKYKRSKPYFPELTSKNDTVSYFTDQNGLFIPVVLNNDLELKMFIDPLLGDSFIDYEYYLKNYDKTPADYLYPFNEIRLGKNVVGRVSVAVKKVDKGAKTSYKIPGIIGSDILSKGSLYINDKKRMLSFYEPAEEKPKNAVTLEIINGYPVFDIMVNNAPVKATISFGSSEPIISEKLKDLLSLRTREIAISNASCESCFIKKAQVIITPPNMPYFKTEAVVVDLEGKPYGLILGLEYIKDKEITINYKDNWFSID